MKRPIASVTGAGGGIGAALTYALMGTHEVRELFRSESARSRALVASGGTVVIGDLQDEAALTRLIAGADLVIHAAAKMTGFKAEEFHAVNVEGTQRVAEIVAGAAGRRMILVSSIAVHGADEPGPDGYRDEEVLPDDQ
ncbi:MAG: NAD-dependent epimerase/dehydratase family protein [Candidatus Synoicihabitans palmerolidicus]|nr:NAD-dependent epimerase/dehydratase family protein [Candidatus Synoicihabitans palmerolidicus]MCC5025938.1 NAD-dependent epimerase/dehydratase family protein [Candidatus Synoicihabitans palmerolidicus]MCC5025977.1 NAD-dependent epimerase/dehydratase family protein [Candidatus Synoicihabitans palmerolidicus]MCC5026021.1 NAD-dependent epimerase/dehydratase family protein [Candidatus Synoicihabitans palmerolidicus]MCC5026053.1 NAD-dependent epimerase/dehydratase family protein [Candidatus Synoi